MYPMGYNCNETLYRALNFTKRESLRTCELVDLVVVVVIVEETI